MTPPSRFKLRTVTLIPLLACGLYLLVFPENEILTPSECKAAGLAVITIGLFVTRGLPEYYTALAFFLFAALFEVATQDIIFSGFQSTALWLLLGGLVISESITSTGLGRRIAGRMAAYLKGSYLKLVTGVTLMGFLFALIMPGAMARVMLLVPIAIAVSKQFGFEKGSNGRKGLVLAAVMGSFLPGFSILPANVPNMILTGMAESQLDVSFLYGEYLSLHLPALGLAKVFLIVATIVRLYPDQPKSMVQEQTAAEPMSAKERILAVTLALLILLWITDFIHNVSPAWVSLGGALFLLVPRLGIIPDDFLKTRFNFGGILFLAGIIGLGNMIKQSGLAERIGEFFLMVLPLGLENRFVDYMSISFASSFTGLIATLPGVPVVLTPLSMKMAAVTGIPVKSILMMNVLGFSTVLLPYQAPPLVVALQAAGEGYGVIVKPLLIIAALSFTILLPLNYLWWRLIGWI